MRYPYPDVIIPIGDNEDIYVEVTYPDAGTTGYTFITVPDGNNKEIKNADKVPIGKGQTLKGDFTIITSNPVNIEPHIDKIRETIIVAGVEVVVHENLKSVDKMPQIEVCVKFQ